MPVEITINWNFLGDGEEAHVRYGTATGGPVPEKVERESAQEIEYPSRVLAPGSSVLAPGLSMPLPAN